MASHKKELKRFFGGDAQSALEQADVFAWQPDLNRKPMKYFIAMRMTQDEFKAWATSAGLETAPTALVPSGIWVLPGGAKLSHWIDGNAKPASFIDARSTTNSDAQIWCRWMDGFAYAVIVPSY